MKGGGDAVSAARAVFADRRIRFRLEPAGRGRDPEAAGGRPARARSSITPSWRRSSTSSSTTPIRGPTVDGERSSIKTKHPFLSDPAVRQALNLLVDRLSVQQYIYGRDRRRHRQLHQQSKAVRLTRYALRIQCPAGDRYPRRRPAGSPAPTASGKRTASSCKIVYQTSVNAPRQKNQEIVKQACQKAGIADRAESDPRVGLLLVGRR